MDLYFRRHEEYLKHYNCSFYSVNQISMEERKRPFVGITLLVLFVVFELLYLPCAIAMANKQLRKNFCYKIMLLMTIFDMLLFFENALFPGYASLHGYQPCDLPHAEFLIGLSMLALWMGYSTYCIILAVNRCLVFTRFSYLFTGKKEYFWLGAPIVITVLIFIFGKPGFYSSVQCAYFFSPHTDYFQDTENYYPFKLHTFNNIMFSILIPVIYLSYFIMNCLLSKQRSTGMSKREYSLFLQVLFVNFTIASASSGYVLFQYVHLPKSLVFLTHVTWVIIEGCPPIIYLSMNKSIQRILMESLRRGKLVSTSSPLSASNNHDSKVSPKPTPRPSIQPPASPRPLTARPSIQVVPAPTI